MADSIAGRLVPWATTVGSGSGSGGLGPVDQDPDQVRQRACDLERVSCGPATTAAPKLPSRAPSLPGWIGDLLLVVLVAALLGALAFVVFQLVRGGGRSARARRKRGEADADVTVADARIIDPSRAPSDWRTEAERHRAGGSFRESIRCRYRALVGDLARAGLLDEIPGRTTGEERDELAASGLPAAPVFDRATELFDGVWYGRVPARADDDDRFQEWESEVLRATRSPAGDRGTDGS